MSVESLKKEIEARGGSDKYIDIEEETYIFKQGMTLGFSRANVEAIVNQMCRDGGWTREQEIGQDLTDMLDETTSDDDAIDEGEFTHCVDYAVSMNMPRKRAMELSVKYVAEKSITIKLKKNLIGFGKDWFEPLRRQYLK